MQLQQPDARASAKPVCLPAPDHSCTPHACTRPSHQAHLMASGAQPAGRLQGGCSSMLASAPQHSTAGGADHRRTQAPGHC
jgi:hypothetical protein